MHKYDYANGTGVDISDFHTAIMDAIRNGGELDEAIADIFALRKTPEGSAAAYVVEFA